jgi:hypothetical protein
MRKRNYVILILSIIILCCLFAFLKTPYQQNDAQKLVQKYIKYIQDGEINNAYELTDKGESIGKTIDLFSNGQDLYFINKNKQGVIILNDILPKQTIGNRLIRTLNMRPVEPNIVILDYSISGIPISFSLKRIKHEWKIVKYGVHAG